MIVNAPLSLIDDNPWQTRMAYDAQAIRDLADSICQLRPQRPDSYGLIHTPPARCIDAESGGLGMATPAIRMLRGMVAQFAGGRWPAS